MPVFSIKGLIMPALLLSLLTTFPEATGAADSQITGWRLVNILRDFRGQPNEQAYRVSSPEILKLDGTGGDLLFRITPRSNPGCIQNFRIRWNFQKDIGIVREKESCGVQLFNQPSGDAGVGLRSCYQQARQRAYDGGFLLMRFLPSHPSHFLEAEPFTKYHHGDAQHLFGKTTGIGFVYPVDDGTKQSVQYALDGFVVKDSPHAAKPGYIDARHGSMTFEISKGGVFTYFVTYLFDAADGTVQGNARGNIPANIRGSVLGKKWMESESGWQGVWRRRGGNVFDARWTKGTGVVTAQMTITISGNQVAIARRGGSDGNDCDYTGVIAADGVTVEGTYSCSRYPGPFSWRATIQR